MRRLRLPFLFESRALSQSNRALRMLLKGRFPSTNLIIFVVKSPHVFGLGPSTY